MNVEWIITERVTGEAQDGGVWVRALGRKTTFLCYANGLLHFDGRYVDVGEDLIQYLSTMDEIIETGASEPWGES